MALPRLVVVYAVGVRPSPVAELVLLAAGDLGVAVGSGRVRHHCPTCGSSDHGRPWLTLLPHEPRVDVAVARCPGRTVVALSLAGPVGVDVERSGSAREQEVDDVLGVGPGDATRRWVRTEALLKAAGHGFARPGAATAITGPRWEGDLDLGEGFEATVAVLTVAGTGPELVVMQAGLGAPSQ